MRQPMISALVENFQSTVSKKFPGNDKIKDATEMLQTECDEDFTTFLEQYNETMVVQELAFAIRRKETLLKYFKFMHKATSDINVSLSDAEFVHEMFLVDLHERYRSKEYKKTEVDYRCRQMESYCIEQSFNRIVQLLEKRKKFSRQTQSTQPPVA
ncbi:uncharacterized protein LOC143445712 [Clavelina lepadiformis]|uniref:uncharacterized protein LOC143445712 n=1 Tax=Clavelina lepadiformis TaxID=159417 RepID=UPI0040431414